MTDIFSSSVRIFFSMLAILSLTGAASGFQDNTDIMPVFVGGVGHAKLRVNIGGAYPRADEDIPGHRGTEKCKALRF